MVITPRRGSVRARMPSRGEGVPPGVFSVGDCIREEVSPGSYLLESV